MNEIPEPEQTLHPLADRQHSGGAHGKLNSNYLEIKQNAKELTEPNFNAKKRLVSFSRWFNGSVRFVMRQNSLSFFFSSRHLYLDRLRGWAKQR